jgi:hypothetical protein
MVRLNDEVYLVVQLKSYKNPPVDIKQVFNKKATEYYGFTVRQSPHESKSSYSNMNISENINNNDLKEKINDAINGNHTDAALKYITDIFHKGINNPYVILSAKYTKTAENNITTSIGNVLLINNDNSKITKFPLDITNNNVHNSEYIVNLNNIYSNTINKINEINEIDSYTLNPIIAKRLSAKKRKERLAKIEKTRLAENETERLAEIEKKRLAKIKTEEEKYRKEIEIEIEKTRLAEIKKERKENIVKFLAEEKIKEIEIEKTRLVNLIEKIGEDGTKEEELKKIYYDDKNKGIFSKMNKDIQKNIYIGPIDKTPSNSSNIYKIKAEMRNELRQYNRTKKGGKSKRAYKSNRITRRKK